MGAKQEIRELILRAKVALVEAGIDGADTLRLRIKRVGDNYLNLWSLGNIRKGIVALKSDVDAAADLFLGSDLYWPNKEHADSVVTVFPILTLSVLKAPKGLVLIWKMGFIGAPGQQSLFPTQSDFAQFRLMVMKTKSYEHHAHLLIPPVIRGEIKGDKATFVVGSKATGIIPFQSEVDRLKEMSMAELERQGIPGDNVKVLSVDPEQTLRKTTERMLMR
ncbi:MAG: hypothetical protein KGL39_58450 [Patescibacteria group bacterium]|nr:hypothetical protein [Patescibacteria group bacterium]